MIETQKPFRKLVIGCQANNECLPFKDETFGAYISNLSLMLVVNPQNQIKEAFRVLKPGKIACFTIWCDTTDWFTCVEKTAQRLFPDSNETPAQESDYLFRDKGVLVKSYLESAGFTGIKIWKQPMNMYFTDGVDYMNKFGDGFLKEIKESKKLNDDQVK